MRAPPLTNNFSAVLRLEPGTIASPVHALSLAAIVSQPQKGGEPNGLKTRPTFGIPVGHQMELANVCANVIAWSPTERKHVYLYLNLNIHKNANSRKHVY